MNHHFRFTAVRRLSGFRSLAAVSALAGLTALSGCKLDSIGGTNPGQQSLVQFVNAAPRYANVSFFIDSLQTVPIQKYGSGSQVYIQALANARQLTVRDSANSTTIATTPLQLVDKTVYAVILTQHASGGGLLVYKDTVTAPPTNQIGLRLINASPSAGPVDVYVVSGDTTLTTPIATNVTFENATNYVHVVTNGLVHLVVTAAGTKTVIINADASSLIPGQVRTIVLIDGVVGGGLPATWLSIPDLG